MSLMRKTLPPYLPTAGVNYDSESLMVQEANCLDIKNLTIDQHELRTRAGLTQVGNSTSLKHEDTLTASESTTRFSGSYLLQEEPSPTTAVVVTVTKGGFAWVMTENVSTWDLLDEQGNVVGDVDRNTNTVNFDGVYPKWVGGSLYDPNTPIGDTDWKFEWTYITEYGYPFQNGEHVVHMAIHSDPDKGDVLFAFTDKGIYLYDDSTGDTLASFEPVLDATVPSFSAITLWSSTEFTDASLGATMVVAGSQPPSAADSDEDDGGNRVLLFWDRFTSTFKPLEPRYESYQYIYEWTGSENPAQDNHLDFDDLVLPPVDTESAVIEWYEGNYKWILTTETAVSGYTDRIIDPDGRTIGLLHRGLGVLYLSDLPENDGVAYEPAAGTTVTCEYTSIINTKPRFVFNMNNRLVMVNTFDTEWDLVANGEWATTGTYKPWRVQWSYTMDITKFNFILSFADNVGVDTSAYVAGEYIGDMLILYRENSIEQMFYVGGVGIFGFRTSVNHGLFAGNTVGLYKDMHFYMGKDNIYLYDGNSARSIADDRVRKHIMNIANTNTLDKFMSFVDNGNAEYWLLIATEADTYPDTAWVYNITMNAWSRYEFPKNISAIQFRSDHFEKPLLGTSDGYVLTLDDAVHTDTWEAWNTTTETYEIATQAIDVMLETRDFVFTGLEDLDRIQRVVLEANSDADYLLANLAPTISLRHSLDYGYTWSQSTDIENNLNPDDRFYWVDYICRKIRFEITSSDYLVLRYIQISGLAKEEK